MAAAAASSFSNKVIIRETAKTGFADEDEQDAEEVKKLHLEMWKPSGSSYIGNSRSAGSGTESNASSSSSSFSSSSGWKTKQSLVIKRKSGSAHTDAPWYRNSTFNGPLSSRLKKLGFPDGNTVAYDVHIVVAPEPQRAHDLLLTPNEVKTSASVILIFAWDGQAGTITPWSALAEWNLRKNTKMRAATYKLREMAAGLGDLSVDDQAIEDAAFNIYSSSVPVFVVVRQERTFESVSVIS